MGTSSSSLSFFKLTLSGALFAVHQLLTVTSETPILRASQFCFMPLDLRSSFRSIGLRNIKVDGLTNVLQIIDTAI